MNKSTQIKFSIICFLACPLITASYFLTQNPWTALNKLIKHNDPQKSRIEVIAQSVEEKIIEGNFLAKMIVTIPISISCLIFLPCIVSLGLLMEYKNLFRIELNDRDAVYELIKNIIMKNSMTANEGSNTTYEFDTYTKWYSAMKNLYSLEVRPLIRQD
jgi:hypothetical protein